MAEGLSERKETKKRRASGWAATLERGARSEEREEAIERGKTDKKPVKRNRAKENRKGLTQRIPSEGADGVDRWGVVGRLTRNSNSGGGGGVN